MNVSIIIPTYNQEERLLSMTLDAVLALRRDPAVEVECVIIDNNSSPPVESLAGVQAFLGDCPWARVVVERKQGLTPARIAGIREAAGKILVFFDDDNVPCPDYLMAAAQCVEEYPWVGAWGAGNITARLLDPVADWLQESVRAIHCVRELDQVAYGSVPGTWQPYYPIGMGQVLRREVAAAYLTAVEAGELGASDRKGRSLSSAGDCQIVWKAVGMGLAAGVHPDLKIEHLVPARRSTVDYVKRATFGTSASYLPAMMQAHPDLPRLGEADRPSSRWVLSRMARLILKNLKARRFRFLSIEVAAFLGDVVGRCRAANSERPRWVFALVRRMGLG